MVRLTRRALLVRSLWGLVLSSCGFARNVSRTPSAPGSSGETGHRLNANDIGTLRICLDLLIPEDHTPSATALGVDRRLLEEAAANPLSQAVLSRGIQWLTREARDRRAHDFISLTESEQIILLNRAEQAVPGSIEQVFFSQLRNRAFHHYYASPAAFSFPDYRQSPQPEGYPDYFKPPGSR